MSILLNLNILFIIIYAIKVVFSTTYIIGVIDATVWAIKYLNNVKDALVDRARLAQKAISLLTLRRHWMSLVGEVKPTYSSLIFVHPK